MPQTTVPAAPQAAPTPPVQASMPMAEAFDLGALTLISRNNPRNLDRQADYESKLRSLTPGGTATVFHLAASDVEKKTGTPSARGLKLRLSHAITRAKLVGIIIQDATITESGEHIVAAFIRAPK